MTMTMRVSATGMISMIMDRSMEDVRCTSLTLEEGDNIFFEGRNFFFVEEGQVLELGCNYNDSKRKRRSSRQFSFTLQQLDSDCDFDEYDVMKELEEAIELGTGNVVAMNTNTNNNPSFEDLSISRADEADFKSEKGTWGQKRLNVRVKPPDLEPKQIGSHATLAVKIPKQYNNNTNTKNTNTNTKNQPSRRFSFQSTPVQNPFEKSLPPQSLSQFHNVFDTNLHEYQF